MPTTFSKTRIAPYVLYIIVVEDFIQKQDYFDIENFENCRTKHFYFLLEEKMVY